MGRKLRALSGVLPVRGDLDLIEGLADSFVERAMNNPANFLDIWRRVRPQDLAEWDDIWGRKKSTEG